MNKYAQRSDRIADEVKTIVAGAPREKDGREHYVHEQIRMLEDSGLVQADFREIEERVRSILGMPQL